VVLSIGLTVVNAVRLEQDIADPLGPPLWLAAMLTLILSGALTSGSGLRSRLHSPRWRTAAPWLALAALLAFGAAIRLTSLATIPLGINPDEGDRASTALDVLDGRAPASWFDSGWYFINMVYFRLLALCMSIFGPDIAGGRMGSALIGIAFLVGLAWLACRHFGWRVGLVTLALATASGLPLQHSRLIAETGPTALLWVISIGCFLEGARGGRPWAFVVAGLSGGLGLYFYPSARLWAVGAVLTVAVIWLFERRGRAAVLVRGFGLAGVATLVATMPFLVHLRTHPIEITGRYAQTAVFDPTNQVRLTYLNPPEPLPRLVALQFERTLGMFDRYPDGGGFLPTGRPLFGPPLAALALIAMAFGLVRSVRDRRLAILSVWFWIGLSGVLVTVETPDMIRAVGILPALFVLMAVVLVELVDRALEAADRLRPSAARPLFAWLVPLGVGLLVLGTDTSAYFTTFRAVPGGWGPMTREGQAIAALGESGPVYSMEMNEHMVTSGWVRLLAPRAARGRIPNPGRELPVLPPISPADSRPQMTPEPGQAMNFLLSGDANQLVYLDLLYQLYPGGWVDDAQDARRAFTVSAAALAETQGVLVRSGGGAPRGVERFGQVPADLALPATVTWSAGVRFPRPGEYRVQVVGPPATQLRIDDVPVTERVRVAPGVHYLEFRADVNSPDTSLAMLIDGRELAPNETYRLMDAPWGLLGRVTGGSPDGFLDATIAMAFFDPEIGPVTAPNVVSWSGTLLAPRSGTYRMAFAAEDQMQLDVDGQRVEVITVPPDGWARVGQGSLVQLTEGAHQVQVTLLVSHGGRELARWNWVPPLPDGTVATGGQWTVVPPMNLRPATTVRGL
jgi:hypothetical protein